MNFLPGKVPAEILQKVVFKHLGAKRSDVVLGPAVGEDAAIVKTGEMILVYLKARMRNLLRGSVVRWVEQQTNSMWRLLVVIVRLRLG